MVTKDEKSAFIGRLAELPTIERVKGAIQDVTGKLPEDNCAGGTSDCRFFAELGIPIVEIGTPRGNMHGANEYVMESDISKLKDIYVSVGKLLGSRWALC